MYSRIPEILVMTAQDVTGPCKPVKIWKKVTDNAQSSICIGLAIEKHLRWTLHVSILTKSYEVDQLRRKSNLPINVKRISIFRELYHQ